MAAEEWNYPSNHVNDPSVYSKEQWAVYSTYPSSHKIIGNLFQGLCSTLGYSEMQYYLQQIHKLSPAKLYHVNLSALQDFLSAKKIPQRVTISKMIHKWNPTYSSLCRQGHETSPLCTHCQQAIETNLHVWTCQQPLAVTCQALLLQTLLSNLVQVQTPLYIIVTLEYKLSLVLEVPLHKKYFLNNQVPQDTHRKLLSAIQHKNIIGWDNFLKGFTSIYWKDLYNAAHSCPQ
jgi:hypothetical protein